jgi:membrane protein DedA with SNARE-associated domain
MMKSFLKFAAPILLIGFVAGYFIAAPLRGGLVAALQTILTTPASAAALIAAILAFVAGVGGPIVSYLIGAKQARAPADSPFRHFTRLRAVRHRRWRHQPFP